MFGRCQVPGQDYQGSKRSIRQGKHPYFRLVKDQLVKPVLDKRTGIGCPARFLPQIVFPDSEWTNHIQPSLYDNDTNCAKVSVAKPGVSNPAPASDKTGDNAYQSENHKGDKQGMNN